MQNVKRTSSAKPQTFCILPFHFCISPGEMRELVTAEGE